jgi:signal transduction histidine kinase
MIINYRKELNEKLTLQNKLYEKTKENQIAFIEGQEAEKKIIAQELHDGIATDIVVVQSIIESEKFQKQADVSNLIKNISKQMRQISYSLFPDVLNELGINEALKSLFQPLDTKIKTHIYFNREKFSLQKNQEVQIYRIAQELLKNTLKHSGANNIYLQIIEHEDEIIMEFEDDGIGFNLSNLKLGLGIKSILSRAESINALTKFETQLNKGIYFSLEINLYKK